MNKSLVTLAGIFALCAAENLDDTTQPQTPRDRIIPKLSSNDTPPPPVYGKMPVLRVVGREEGYRWVLEKEDKSNS